MKAETITEWLNALTLAERAKALNEIGFELTIHARAYGLALTDPDTNKLIGINELQHKLLSQAGLYLSGEQSKIYPVDVFSRILIEQAGYYGIGPALAAAVARVQTRMARGG